MRKLTITNTYEVFNFSELSKSAKDDAAIHIGNMASASDWWAFTFEDARTVGIEIIEFDLYRYTCRIKPLVSFKEIADNIIENHGTSCITHQDSLRFKEGVLSEKDFKECLQDSYIRMSQREYDYLFSHEHAQDYSEVNEIEFLEDGSIFDK